MDMLDSHDQPVQIAITSNLENTSFFKEKLSRRREKGVGQYQNVCSRKTAA
jgi:hypothetical protein